MVALSKLRLQKIPLRKGAAAVYDFDEAISAQLTGIEDKYDEPFDLCRRVGDTLLVPRALCPPSPNDETTRGRPASFPLMPVAYDYQEPIIAETLAFIDEGKSGVVIAWTGWGKTVLGYAIAAHVQRKTLVVATKDDVFKQWIEDAPTFLGIDPKRVGQIRADKCQVKDKDFVVAMVHSIAKEDRYPAWIYDEFGLIIFDEVQRMPSEAFSGVGYYFPAKWRVGITAHVGRGDGKEVVVAAHIGPVRVTTGNEPQKQVPKVIRLKSSWTCPRVPFENEQGQKQYRRLPHDPGRTTKVDKSLMADVDRNGMLADAITAAFEKSRNVVFFSTEHAHLETIYNLLVNERDIDPLKIGIYVGESTKAAKIERDRQKTRPIILTTYIMAGEGTNVPEWDTCVFGIPRAKVQQPLGRVRRAAKAGTTKLEPICIDLVDMDSPVYMGYAVARLGFYKSIGAPVNDLNF